MENIGDLDWFCCNCLMNKYLSTNKVESINHKFDDLRKHIDRRHDRVQSQLKKHRNEIRELKAAVSSMEQMMTKQLQEIRKGLTSLSLPPAISPTTATRSLLHSRTTTTTTVAPSSDTNVGERSTMRSDNEPSPSTEPPKKRRKTANKPTTSTRTIIKKTIKKKKPKSKPSQVETEETEPPKSKTGGRRRRRRRPSGKRSLEGKDECVLRSITCAFFMFLVSLSTAAPPKKKRRVENTSKNDDEDGVFRKNAHSSTRTTL